MAAASDYIFREEFGHVCALLTRDNRLAVELSLCTGLRIGDVLALRRVDLAEEMTVTEQKTGKTRTVTLTPELLRRCRDRSARSFGSVWLFPGRLDPNKHRTRQAVYKDMKRAARALRLPKVYQISPHTARKVFAVELFTRHGGDLRAVQQIFAHSDPAVTMLYAMADVLTERRTGRRLRGDGDEYGS